MPTPSRHSRTAKGAEVPIVRLEPLLIGSIFPTHGEDRIVVQPEEVPPLLPAALKAVEDRKFDTHHGVDPTAIARAVWANVRAGGIAQGGSTLTQQLVRSYFLTTDQTLGRKFREAVMAIALESHFTKADLMNAYINEIYLGQDGQRAVHGFGLASQFYFGKPLPELDLSEVALLVAVVRGPVVLRSAAPSGARARAARPGAEDARRAEGHQRRGCEGRGEAPARRRHRATPAATTRRIWISSAARCAVTIARRISPKPACASTRASIRARRSRPNARWSTSSGGSTRCTLQR